MAEITNELNDYLDKCPDSIVTLQGRRELFAIGERIERALARCYIGLPKDRDGEPWHIGDRIDDPRALRVASMEYDGSWKLVGEEPSGHHKVRGIDPGAEGHAAHLSERIRRLAEGIEQTSYIAIKDQWDGIQDAPEKLYAIAAELEMEGL